MGNLSDLIAKTYEFLVRAGALLPVTALVAVLLFVAREILEGKRRKDSSSRKKRAISRLMAYDIERNYWALKSTRQCLETITDQIAKPDGVENLSIRVGSNGEKYFQCEEPDGSTSSSPIRKVFTGSLTSNLLILADLDERQFEATLDAIDAINELNHVIDSMVIYVSDDLPNGHDRSSGFMEGFVEYAERVLNDCEEAFKKFYKIVTGNVLDSHRVR
ncbi:hypothetical protein [Rhodobacter ferrooxidans]|uniref:Uncharacterized protein n=1 Tax=Rhodobacter ferrooxidans TaxID=371731 RepID=C8RWL0_9RHOB|nr:hypothetical protein [Rhodobacter sp. SW2]EEW26953.1 hypothetical protein Rsw2DRAFT_0188 [Rhodobacter sp. SW2]